MVLAAAVIYLVGLVDDFRDVFDFKVAFENYKIESPTAEAAAASWCR